MEPAPGEDRRAHARAEWRAFIVFQVAFWGLFFAMRALAAWLHYPDLFWSYMGPRAAIVALYAIGTTGVHILLLRVRDWRPLERMGLALALCGMLMVPLHFIERAITFAHVREWPAVVFLDYISQFGWVFIMWAGYYFARDHAIAMERQANELLRVQTAAHLTQLKMLRYQLNPHFLFNSLNAISTLVLEKRNDDAEATILKLSRFLRHTIDADPDHFTPVGDEAALLKLYLDIESERFGERLRIRCKIPAHLEDCLVPSLLIQPAIENAIKHGVQRTAGVGELRIEVSQQGKRLITVVEDNGPGPPAKITGGGLGLRNTRARLLGLYGSDASVTLSARPEGGARVTFDVPLRRATIRKRA